MIHSNPSTVKAIAGAIACLFFAVSPSFAMDPPKDGVRIERQSVFTKLVPASAVENRSTAQYSSLKNQAASKNALAPANHPQLVRLRSIAAKIIPHALRINPRAREWKWEVNLIGSRQINAFCMPGGKIAFYSGILDTLALNDDEIAMVMGHEIAHALQEHARERMAKGMATGIGANILGQIVGNRYGDMAAAAVNGGGSLLKLSFSRDDETEADTIGLDIASRAGFDPRAGISLWQKMSAANKGAPPQWLSTHPSGKSRIEEMRRHLPEVMPLYARANGLDVNRLPPYPRRSR